MVSYLHLAFLLGVFGACTASFVFEESQYAVIEGKPFEYCLLGDGDDSTEEILVNITRSYAVGTVIGNDQISLPVGFGDGDTECITVNAVNNGRIDNGNIITLSIDDSEAADAEVEVFDDDIVMVGFSEEEYTATEGESIPVCVEILEAEVALGRSIPFRVFTSADCDDDDEPVVEPFKRIYLFPLRSKEEDTVCFDIDILQNSVDEDDYGSFKLHIDVGSDLNVWVPRDRAYVPVHVEPAVECNPVFVNDTPKVDGNDFTVEVSDCVFERGLACTVELQGSGVVDCAQGGVTLSSGSNRPRALTLLIPDEGVNMVRTVRRDHDVCYVHPINQGITNYGSDSVMFEFEGTGPSDTVQVSNFTCTVIDDDNENNGVPLEPQHCTSPYMFDRPNTASGFFYLDILPMNPASGPECRRRPTVRFTLSLPPLM